MPSGKAYNGLSCIPVRGISNEKQRKEISLRGLHVTIFNISIDNMLGEWKRVVSAEGHRMGVVSSK